MANVPGDYSASVNKQYEGIVAMNKARSELMSQLGLSIKRSTYNADSSLGDVDWKKNIDGSSSTLNMKPNPANTRN